MNGSKSLDAPLFLLTEEERFRREQEERWRDAFDRAMAAPQSAKKRHSGPLSPRCTAILGVLSDGQWHETTEFLGPKIGGSEGMRRLRELSKRYAIERKRKPKSSQWLYRLKTEEWNADHKMRQLR